MEYPGPARRFATSLHRRLSLHPIGKRTGTACCPRDGLQAAQGFAPGREGDRNCRCIPGEVECCEGTVGWIAYDDSRGAGLHRDQFGEFQLEARGLSANVWIAVELGRSEKARKQDRASAILHVDSVRAAAGACISRRRDLENWRYCCGCTVDQAVDAPEAAAGCLTGGLGDKRPRFTNGCRCHLTVARCPNGVS